MKVGSTGDMQLRGGLFVGSTQDALSSSNSALVSAGGLSVAKGAVIGGRVRVDETQDAASTGAGALQVAGGLAVGKRAFFGGSVFVGRQSGSGTGARKLEVRRRRCLPADGPFGGREQGAMGSGQATRPSCGA